MLCHDGTQMYGGVDSIRMESNILPKRGSRDPRKLLL